MEIYVTATIIFLIIFILRIALSCWMSHRRGERPCPCGKPPMSNAADSDDEGVRRSADRVYVIECLDVEPPSYENLMADDQLPPPAYEDAVKMPPIQQQLSPV